MIVYVLYSKFIYNLCTVIFKVAFRARKYKYHYPDGINLTEYLNNRLKYQLIFLQNLIQLCHSDSHFKYIHFTLSILKTQ